MGRYITEPCGTPTAFRRHYRFGETPCDACKEANDRWRENREKLKGYEPVAKPDDPGWRSRAACRDTDVDWFPSDEGGEAACVAVCEGCPVSRECLSDALSVRWSSYDRGVRGGLTERERKSLRRMLKVSA